MLFMPVSFYIVTHCELHFKYIWHAVLLAFYFSAVLWSLWIQ